jgi:hypothetical protein
VRCLSFNSSFKILVLSLSNNYNTLISWFLLISFNLYLCTRPLLFLKLRVLARCLVFSPRPCFTPWKLTGLPSLYFAGSLTDKCQVRLQEPSVYFRGFQTVGCVPPRGRRWSSGGRKLIVWGTYLFLMKCGCKKKYIFWQALCLVDIFYLSLSTGTGSKLLAARFVAG